MNRGLCNSCKKVVPAKTVERGGKIYLAKTCPKCGLTETLISSDARRYNNKRGLDTGASQRECHLHCLDCAHGKPPGIVFIDVTNRCNMNCPICVNNTPSDGFSFEPPMEYFKKIFEHFATYKPQPAMQLFGGEPTVREDLIDIIKLAQSYGLRARVLTNGLRLADEAYCRKIVETRVRLLLAYDGNNPALYRDLRGSVKAMELKEKALDNIGKVGKGRVTLMTVLSDYNAAQLPEFFRFCHERRAYIGSLYFLPLAHTWDSNEWEYSPEQMTTEDLERFVDQAFPDDHIEFLPAGLIGTLSAIRRCFRIKPLPFMGAHPNCESFYLFLSNGQEYVPFSRYLKGSPIDAAHGLVDAEQKLARRLEALDKSAFGRFLDKIRLKEEYLYLLGTLALIGVFRRHVKWGPYLKGRGIGKAWHALMIPLQLAFGLRAKTVMERHSNVQRALEVLALPLEDPTNIEADRMERCPSAFAYYDPREDQVHTVPFCTWNTLHRKTALSAVAEYYGTSQKNVGTREKRFAAAHAQV